MSFNSEKWLANRREVPGSRLRLFCFPFGGGGASVFSSWQKGVPANIEICPVQPPGRENRLSEAPITRMPQMVLQLVEVLAPYLNLPFALYGHSVGALICFELARQLRRQGLRSPQWLFVSGHPSPDLPRRRPKVSHLARPELIKALREHFEVAPELLDNQDLLDFILPTLRADYELVETYAYQEEPPFEFPVSVFGGSRDPEAKEDEILAWRKHTTGPFRTKILEGNHMFINNAREALVGEISKDLRRLEMAPEHG